jgi:hypothetical protein
MCKPWHEESAALGPLIKLLLAVFPLVISGGALWISRRVFIAAKRPVLVFERTSDSWIIKNVGNGPALNLVFAEGNAEGWLSPYKLPSISKDHSYQLKGLKSGARLGVVYFDFEERLYSSECTNYITKMRSNERPAAFPKYDATKLPFDWSQTG